MKRGAAFTPDGPLTLGDLMDITDEYRCNSRYSRDQIVEVRTPMGPDRRQVTLTVTNQRWQPPVAATDAGPSDAETEGNEH